MATKSRPTNRKLPKHRPDLQSLDCTCGAEVIYFSGTENDSTKSGYGCSALGRPTEAFAGYKED